MGVVANKKTIYLMNLWVLGLSPIRRIRILQGIGLDSLDCPIIGALVMGLYRSARTIPKIRYWVGLMRMKRALLEKFYWPGLI